MLRAMNARRIVIGALVVAAMAQLVPVKRTNPTVGTEVAAPPEIAAILHRACWDCHSNETVWGWHTYVAPISWLVIHDVNEGRGELNFSRWETVDATRLAKLRRKIAEEVGEGDMPLRLYVLAHPSARLSDADRAAVVAWGRAAQLAAGASAAAPAVTRGAALDDDRDGEHRHGRDGR